MLVLRFEFQKFRILKFFELSPMWYPYLMTVLGYMHSKNKDTEQNQNCPMN